MRITTIRSSGSSATAGSAQLHGVTGAALLGLERDLDGAGAEARVERGLHGLELVTEDRDDARGPAVRAVVTTQCSSGRPATRWSTLASVALHPRAEPCGHDEDERGWTTHVA